MEGHKTNKKNLSQPEKPLRIISLGGLEEVGRNMILIEYQNQVLIIDVGLRFPEENMPGIDFIIPNIEYLTTNPQKEILGIFITHGHYDHLGAIPYLIKQLNYPTIYTAPLSRGIILKRQEDFPGMKKLDIVTIRKERNEAIKLGPFIIRPFHVNHNIPDSIGLAIQTPQGLIIHTCDFKFDFQPVADKPADLSRIVKLANNGTTLLMSDSTGVENPGHSISEKTIMENLEKIFEEASGRVILATFSSLIGRLQQAIWLSEKFNRKVAIEGYAMKSNIAIAQHLNYLQVKKNTLIKTEEAIKLPPNQVTILCTGAQGEGNATLMRLANKEHKYLRIQTGDSVIFSSSVVPGNELTVQHLKDNLARQGAKVYHYKMLDIHASGHAYQEDLKLMINLTQPKFFMPIHGHYFMLRAHADIAQQLGIGSQNIVIPANGQVVEMMRDKIVLTEKFVPANYVMVDGLGVGDVGEIVLRDRQTLAKDGIFVVVVLINSKTGQLQASPEIISRGFIYMKESKDLIKEVKEKIEQVIKRSIAGQKPYTFNETYIRNNLREELGMFLFKKTERRPMILPLVIEV